MSVGASSQDNGQQQQTVSANRAAANKASQVNQDALDLAGVPAPVERAIRNPAPKDETEHVKRDLAAQETSAMWAFWLATIAAVQAVISALGIFFIIKTLQQNSISIRAAFAGLRQAGRQSRAAEGSLKLAQKASAVELRPYLFVDRLELSDRRSVDTEEVDEDGEPIPGMFSGRIVIYLRNFGKVPARKIRVFLKEYLGRRHVGRFWQFSFSKIAVPICAPNHERRVFGSLYIRPQDRIAFDIGSLSKVIRLRFTYEDDLGETYTEKAAFILYGGDLETFYLLTDVRVAELRERAREWELELDEPEAEEPDEERRS